MCSRNQKAYFSPRKSKLYAFALLERCVWFNGVVRDVACASHNAIDPFQFDEIKQSGRWANSARLPFDLQYLVQLIVPSWLPITYARISIKSYLGLINSKLGVQFYISVQSSRTSPRIWDKITTKYSSARFISLDAVFRIDSIQI